MSYRKYRKCIRLRTRLEDIRKYGEKYHGHQYHIETALQEEQKHLSREELRKLREMFNQQFPHSIIKVDVNEFIILAIALIMIVIIWIIVKASY